MASKNITTVISIVLVVVAFMVGVYLPKLINKSDTEQISTETPIEAPNTEQTIKVDTSPNYQSIKVESGIYNNKLIFTDMDAGIEVPLSEFRDKFVVVSLWKTGCLVCTYDLRGLMKMKELYAGKPIEFIALSLDTRGASNAYYFLQQQKLDVRPLYMDLRNTIRTQRKSNKLPETLFIGPSGKILGNVNQPIDWYNKESQKLLDSYLKQTGLN